MPICYHLSPLVSDEALNRLFAASWGSDQPHSLAYVCAYDDEQRLVGFVNVAWDGGVHAFVLDTTVHPDVRRKGIGQELVRRAADAARRHGIVWLHVDYEPHLTAFYESCGFIRTEAGLLNLHP